ncbi:MAG: hypothetical protein ACKODX_17355 [Gemmata sp.]
MGPLPIAQWQEALDRMDAALAGTVRALDRSEERCDRAVAPSAGEGEPPPALDRLDARLGEWADRLRTADELASAVEGELADRSAAVERWRALFAGWEELVQQRPGTS